MKETALDVAVTKSNTHNMGSQLQPTVSLFVMRNMSKECE